MIRSNGNDFWKPHKHQTLDYDDIYFQTLVRTSSWLAFFKHFAYISRTISWESALCSGSLSGNHYERQWWYLLVSTYVVCERLSVMHEPAGVVEILVQILQNTPILKYSFRIPPPLPRKWKLSEILALWLFSFRIPPPLPRKLKFRQILAL